MSKGRSRLIIAATVLVTLIVISVAWIRHREKRTLEAYKRELVAKGECLSTAPLLPPPTEIGQNALPEIMSAGLGIPDGQAAPHNPPPLMEWIGPGKARIGWQRPDLPSYTVTNTWRDLAADVASGKDGLEKLHVALQRPRYGSALNYGVGFGFSIPHLYKIKSLGLWEAAVALHELHEGRPNEAGIALVDLLHLGRLQAQEPLLISQLVRTATAWYAYAETWDALQSDGWNDRSLAGLQDAWSSNDFILPMLRSLEMERAMGIVTIARLRDSPAELRKWAANRPPMTVSEGTESAPVIDLTGIPVVGQAVEDSRQGIQRFANEHIWRWHWSYNDERLYLLGLQVLIEAGRELAQSRNARAPFETMQRRRLEIDAELKGDVLAFRFADMPVHSLYACLHKAVRMQVQRELAVAAIAIKRYQLRYGKLPGNLNMLAPEFLTSAPIDYMDGQSLRYHLNADGTFTLYSVGFNFVDDGGSSERLPDESDKWNTKDLLWPKAATEQEIDAFEAQSKKKK